MGPRTNSKAVAANERKAKAAGEKAAIDAQAKERAESDKWATGSKDASKKAAAEEKRKLELEKKLERERLLAEEEAAIGAKKPTLKGVDKKAAQKSASLELFQKESEAELPEFSASGLDGALELMSLATTADNLKASERLDRHPERRVKSAYAAFEERELPILKAENPGLRLTQLKQQLQKTWKKSPENPMNQAHISYDTKRSDEKGIVQSNQDAALEQYQTKK